MRWEINHLATEPRKTGELPYIYLVPGYLPFWVLPNLVLQIVSLTQSITYFLIVTLIFWFFSFSIAFFFMASCCCCIRAYNIDQRFSFLRVFLLEKLALQSSACVTTTYKCILPALSPTLLLMKSQHFGQECPDVKIFLGELSLPLNSFL